MAAAINAGRQAGSWWSFHQPGMISRLWRRRIGVQCTLLASTLGRKLLQSLNDEGPNRRLDSVGGRHERGDDPVFRELSVVRLQYRRHGVVHAAGVAAVDAPMLVAAGRSPRQRSLNT